MSWLQNLTAGFALRTFMASEGNPHKVTDVRIDTYRERPIIIRDDSLVLYGPRSNPSHKDKYEIILQRPYTETLNQGFSLFRGNTIDEGQTKFLKLSGKIPHLVNICREINSTTGLQKVCDTLEEHPSWNMAHVCSWLSYESCFMDPVVQRYKSTPDATGVTPVHVAIMGSNLHMIQLLSNLGSSLDDSDKEGNTVFHFAAITNKDIIVELAKKARSVLNNRNLNGHTPLHVACLADKPDCVKALLCEGADVNMSATHSSVDRPSTGSLTSAQPVTVGGLSKEHSMKLNPEDMKYGGTPLHWASSREVIEALIDMGCDLNAINFNGQTALHVMVLRKRLDCVVALLGRQASVNVPDPEGNTPLHLAVGTGLLPVVQALVVFGAELSFLNNTGATARHLCPNDTNGEKAVYLLHAVGAQRCPPNMEGCSRGCIYSEDGGGFPGIPPSPIPDGRESRATLDQMLTVAGMNVVATSPHKRPVAGGRVLCLDGGGIRGLVLVAMLLELEAVLGGRRILDCFDWVAGTSTGGILALALASGKTLQECLSLYMRMKDLAFVGGRPYPSEPLENILKQTLGAQTTMADLTGPKLMITGVLADRKPVDLHLFRNYPSPNELLGVPHGGPSAMFLPPETPEETKVWQAARASGAAPSYFRAFGCYLDGGLIANNPTLDVLTEIHEYNVALGATGREAEARPAAVVVSLGTGIVPISQVKAIDVFRPESIFDTARLYLGVTALGTLLVDQATASDGRVVDRARAWCSMAGVPYYRFSPRMSEDVALDERANDTLVNMMWEAKAFMHANKSQLAELALFLADD